MEVGSPWTLMSYLITLVEDLGKKSIGFRSLCDGVINTTTASGELIFNIFSSLAQFERRLSEREFLAPHEIDQRFILESLF